MGLLSDLQNNLLQLSPAAAPLAAFGLAVLASPHCASMCGVFCLGASRGSKKKEAIYHGGRLVSYLVLGGVAGYLGERALLANQLIFFISLLVLVALLALASHQYFSKYLAVVMLPSQKILKYASKFSTSLRPFVFGMASGALPCGLLYVFILAALATHSSSLGSLVLFAFWLGPFQG